MLNSLPGAAQRAGLELLAFGGRFVEIGKRDIYGDTRLGLFPFRRNLSLYAVDLALMTHTHPETVRQLLDHGLPAAPPTACCRCPPITHYPMGDAATAVRLIGGAGHSGKVVLDVPQDGQQRGRGAAGAGRGVPSRRRVRRHRWLGGLGLFLAGEMAAAGCGRIVLNSRSAPECGGAGGDRTASAPTGADVHVELGDVAEPGTAERLVAAATATGLPVRGVLHAAAVVEDATLTNVTAELIDRCWAPKVYGAWNIHQALRDAEAEQPLDWFCSFSSAAALVGSPGQGAYAAANSWLDAFAHWRRAQGLPGTAIAWGAWAEVGRATAFAEDFGVAIAPDEGARALKALLRHDRAYSGYAPLVGTPWLTAFAQRSPFAEAFQSIGQGPDGHRQVPGRAQRAAPRGMARHDPAAGVRPDQPAAAPDASIRTGRCRSMVWTRWAIWNCAPASRPRPGCASAPTHITTVRGLADHLCEQLAAQEAAPATS